MRGKGKLIQKGDGGELVFPGYGDGNLGSGFAAVLLKVKKMKGGFPEEGFLRQQRQKRKPA